MKKTIVTVMCLVLLAASSLTASAQDRYGRNREYRRDNYGYNRYQDRSVWDKHRDKITTAAGALGGAALGGAIGGKKGAIIGAIAGGAGSAIYTYKIRKKDRRRYY